MHLLLFLAVVFVQFQGFQMLALLCFVLATLLSFVKVFLYDNKIKKKHFIYLFIWVAMVAVMMRPDYVTSLEARVSIIWLSLGAMTFIITAINDKIDRKAVLKSIISAGVFGAMVNLFSYATNWFHPLIINLPYAGTRWVGGFDGPNELSAFYVMILALILGMYLEKEFSFPKALLLFSIVVPFAYLGYSRGSLLGLSGLIIIFMVYSIVKSKYRFILTIFYAIVSWVLYKFFLQDLIFDFNNIRQRASDRDYLFSESLRLLKESPIIGHGLGSFGDLSFVVNEVPHSDYLVFMVSGGLIGLTILLAFYIAFIKRAYVYKFYPELLALLVYMSQAFTFNNIVRGRISVLFWIIVILIYLGSKSEFIKKRKEKIKAPQ